MRLTYTKFYRMLVALAVSLSLLLPAMAQAEPADLEVQFESTPLFQEANIAPGKSVTKWVKVKNNTSASQPIAVEAINKTDPTGFAQYLDVIIKQGDSELFSGTLKQFFDAGEKKLSDVPAGTQAQYDFTVTFKTSAGDDVQGKSLGFDLLVGFQGQGGGTSSGGGTSGGGGGLPPGLSIFEDRIYVDNITSTSAVVHWTTSYSATSQVIYASDSEYATTVFQLVPPSYGYPHFTSEDPAMVTVHAVQLTGLSPLTHYHFRVISHASPATVSFDHTFTTLPELLMPTEIPGQVAGEQTGNADSGEKIAGGVAVVKENPGSGEAGPGDGQIKGESVSRIVAKQEPSGAFCNVYSWWPLGYAAYLLLLLIGYWLQSRRRLKAWWLVPTVLLIAGLAWWYFEPCREKTWQMPAILAASYLVALWAYKYVSAGTQNPPPAQLPQEQAAQ